VLVSDDLERRLLARQGSLPRPDPTVTEAVRARVLQRYRKQVLTRRARFLPIAIIAAAALAFGLGHWLDTSAGGAPPSAALVASTAGKAVTVWCRSPFMAYLDPEGRITVLQYSATGDAAYGRDANAASGVPTPTGFTIAYMDATTRSLTRVCARGPTPKVRPNVLAGPWPRSVASRVYCGAAKRFVQIELRPVLDRAGRQIGNRLIAAQDRLTVVDARLTRAGGSIRFDPNRCERNRIP
jgi:hypothetical protein